MKLTKELKGKKLLISKVNIEDLMIRHKLLNIGLTEGSEIEVLEYNKDDKVLHLLIFGVEYVLRAKDCAEIEVEIINNEKK